MFNFRKWMGRVVVSQWPWPRPGTGWCMGSMIKDCIYIVYCFLLIWTLNTILIHRVNTLWDELSIIIIYLLKSLPSLCYPRQKSTIWFGSWSPELKCWHGMSSHSKRGAEGNDIHKPNHMGVGIAHREPPRRKWLNCDPVWKLGCLLLQAKYLAQALHFLVLSKWP